MGSFLPANAPYLIRIRMEHIARLMMPGHFSLGEPEHFSCRNNGAEIQEVAQPALYENNPTGFQIPPVMITTSLVRV
jgi:hypothetical protein